ncbi:uncharacterized protein LOC143276829 [Babylonia areolata]|uniref:uncharacterized protein LOC143276829 n=1 Tax=Babylonia areolata TaxID=304850 RepID=UPI003FCF4A50
MSDQIRTRKKCLESLGLTQSASDVEIKKAYKALALQYHPDKNKSTEATARFQEISAAYAFLTESPDTLEAEGFQNPFDININFFMEMFFNTFFNQFHEDSSSDEEYYAQHRHRYSHYRSPSPRPPRASYSASTRSESTSPSPPRSFYAEQTGPLTKGQKKRLKEKRRAQERRAAKDMSPQSLALIRVQEAVDSGDGVEVVGLDQRRDEDNGVAGHEGSEGPAHTEGHPSHAVFRLNQQGHHQDDETQRVHPADTDNSSDSCQEK